MIILLTDGSPVLTMHHFSAVDDMPYRSCRRCRGRSWCDCRDSDDANAHSLLSDTHS